MPSTVDIVIYYDGSALFTARVRRVGETTLVLDGDNEGLLSHMVVDVELSKASGPRGVQLRGATRLPARVTRVSPQRVDLELECQTADLPWLPTLGPRTR